jgi:hypothetical protein
MLFNGLAMGAASPGFAICQIWGTGFPPAGLVVTSPRIYKAVLSSFTAMLILPSNLPVAGTVGAGRKFCVIQLKVLP